MDSRAGQNELALRGTVEHLRREYGTGEQAESELTGGPIAIEREFKRTTDMVYGNPDLNDHGRAKAMVEAAKTGKAKLAEFRQRRVTGGLLYEAAQVQRTLDKIVLPARPSDVAARVSYEAAVAAIQASGVRDLPASEANALPHTIENPTVLDALFSAWVLRRASPDALPRLEPLVAEETRVAILAARAAKAAPEDAARLRMLTELATIYESFIATAEGVIDDQVPASRGLPSTEGEKRRAVAV